MTSQLSTREVECESWAAMIENYEGALSKLDVRDGESLWFRGCRDRRHTLTPSLMRLTDQLTQSDHNGIEQDLFFQFQARAAELRAQGLTDWEYLFYGRHYSVPTRVLDWTDTFGVALYFAVEEWMPGFEGEDQKDRSKYLPAIWILNPFALNSRNWDFRDIILPKYLGLGKDQEYWDFGELLAASGAWAWDAPVAIYPAQINDRVRAQRGWFTIHGNDRRPLEVQAPRSVVKLVLKPKCIDEALEFLELAGLHRFSLYPDLENLALWIRQGNLAWANRRRAHKFRRTEKRRTTKVRDHKR